MISVMFLRHYLLFKDPVFQECVLLSEHLRNFSILSIGCFPVKANKEPYLTKEKINIVDGINDSYKITDEYPKWDKSLLMCLKTMLNDNDHPYSQILPVAYAISIGNDTLEDEIISLKEVFS